MGVSKKKKRRRRTAAQRADRHDLYQRSVQAPEADIEFFERVFRKLRKRKPRSLREDFCGTALLAATWVESGGARSAVGVDLDAATLAWAERHNRRRLAPKARRRLRLLEADVRDGTGVATDITCAMNFSFNVFKTRAELLSYFAAAHRGLADDGVFFLEIYGGTEAIVAIEEERQAEGFTMIWEQESYNPITHDTRCHIHFTFDDGSRLESAFSYDWRLWSLPETRELLAEAGFGATRVYWEEVDDEGEGTGEHHRSECEENQETWLAYLVAVK